MAVNTTLESTDEMNEIISQSASSDDQKVLPFSLQKKFNALCKTQFTISYQRVLKKVRKELTNK